MSYISGLQNKNQVIKVIGVSTATAASSAAIYLVVPKWVNFATIKSIIVVGSNTFSNLSIALLSDGAAYRNASTANKPKYILATEASTATTVQSYQFNEQCYYQLVNKL